MDDTELHYGLTFEYADGSKKVVYRPNIAYRVELEGNEEFVGITAEECGPGRC